MVSTTRQYNHIKEVHREERGQQIYGLNEAGEVTHRTSISDPLTEVSLFTLANSSGFLDGYIFDTITTEKQTDGSFVLNYSNEGLTLFIISIRVSNQGEFLITKKPAVYQALLENGDYLLLEDGFNLQVQGLIP